MSDQAEIKVCPHCAETIKAAAKVCPYCQSRQSRFTPWAQELAGAIGVLSCFGIIIWTVALAFTDKKLPDYSKFSRHRNELDVVRVSVERTQNGQVFWVSGCVTNKGNIPWRVHELEVRFLDSHDNLLNVTHSECNSPFVVQPIHEAAFRVRLGELAYTNTAPKHVVLVHTASEGNQIYDSD